MVLSYFSQKINSRYEMDLLTMLENIVAHESILKILEM
jgi:hypothetical protein